MADVGDQEPQVAENVAQRERSRLKSRLQVTQGVELRNGIRAAQQDLLRNVFGPRVAEDVEYEDPDLITADLEIIDILRLADFQGPAWIEFADALVSYGHPVMKCWLVTGKIFAQCQAKGFGLERPVREKWLRADHEGFANEVVARGLNSFKRALQGGAWSHKGGASLRTFFMGACVLEFPNLYRRWWLNVDSQSPTPTIVESNIDTRPDLSLGDLVTMRIEIQEALISIDDDTTRAAVLLDFAGYSHREIAELLGITTRGVEGRLRRQRERRRNKPWWGRGGENDV